MFSGRHYLSDTVLTVSVKCASLKSSIKDVLVANSPLTEKVINVVNETIPSTDCIAMNNVSANKPTRLQLEQQISQLQSRISETENNLIQYYMSDTTGKIFTNGTGAVKMYLLGRLNPENQKRLVNVYFTQQDYKSAQTMLKNIKQVSANEVAFVKFYNLLAEAKNAEALLSMVYGNEYPLLIEELNFSESSVISRMEDESVQPRISNSQFLIPNSQYPITVIPNPNNGTMQIFYDLQNQSSATFEIYNLAGQKIFSEILVPDKKNILLSPTQLKNGMYMYRVIQEQKIIATDKLVIVK